MIGPEGHRRFQELLTVPGTFVLTTHMNPDGDAIGSEIGLARLLSLAGASVRIVNQEPTPSNLAFVEDPSCAVEVYRSENHDRVMAEAKRIVLLDNWAPERLGILEPMVRRSADRVLCIDHHRSAGSLWRDAIVDESASATAEMVYELAIARGWKPDRIAAEGLYLGLATDTGFFRFNFTQPRTHEIAAELLRLGAVPARCYEQVYERNSPQYARLLGRALADLRMEAEGKVGSVRLTLADMAAVGAEDVDTSEIVTFLLAVEGVRIALLFKELSGGRVKVSLRSKGNVDVHSLAVEFGGGGHRNASGIVTEGRLDEVEAEVLRRALGLLRR